MKIDLINLVVFSALTFAILNLVLPYYLNGFTIVFTGLAILMQLQKMEE